MYIFQFFPELTLDEKLTFNSTTNLMGPRKFLHHGLLRKSKSSKEIVAFLFNDFLLLTYPSKSVAPQFSFDRHHDLKLRLYKKPIFLDEISVLEGKYFFKLQKLFWQQTIFQYFFFCWVCNIVIQKWSHLAGNQSYVILFIIINVFYTKKGLFKTNIFF